MKTSSKTTKTSKTPTGHKATSGRAASATSARGAAKKTTAKAKTAVTSIKKKVKKAVQTAAKKVAAPKGDQARLHELLEGFSTVMLVTSEGSGDKSTLRARPMGVAKLDEDCTLTFMTDVKTEKVDEAKKEGVGHVIAQSKATFVSLSGTIEVVRDRARIEAAWKPADKVYFPKGVADPNICLLVVHPAEAEIWDVSGTKGFKYLFEAARALLSGERPKQENSAGTHDVLALPTPTPQA